MAATWIFREKNPTDMHYDPANTEFFADQHAADRLVREAGQNALDAAAQGDAPVRLLFRITSVPAEAWNLYFRDLWPHLEAQAELRRVLPPPRATLRCLNVEDFGTTGLTGPLEPDSRAAQHSEEDHRLFWFFKNAGRTSKGDGRLGSFGIGKTVFPSSSVINTFFGYSVREARIGESSCVLVGQAQLREHRLDNTGADYDPFGLYLNCLGRTCTPIDDTPSLAHFRNVFQLRRSTHEPGLSVTIPYVDDNLTATALTTAVARNFFLPILERRLVVEIQDQDASVITLDAIRLEEALTSLLISKPGMELANQITLARWSISRGPTELINIERPTNVAQPEVHLPLKDREQLGRRLRDGETLAFRIPVPIERNGATVEWSYVDLFAQYDPSLTTSQDMYTRDGLSLVDLHGRARIAGLRSLLIARDEPVATMLRSSENIAHTSWRQRGAERLTRRYKRGPAKVRYVLGLLKIVRALLTPEEEEDWSSFATFFPQPSPSSLKLGAVEKRRGGARGPRTAQESSAGRDGFPTYAGSRPRQWTVDIVNNHVQIMGNHSFVGDLHPMRVRFAYGLLNRKGYSKHDPSDFSFSESPRLLTGVDADVSDVQHNSFMLSPRSKQFSLIVGPFDPHRALDYSVRTVPASNEEE